MQHRAWRIHGHGGAEVLRLETLAVPEPRADEVRIRVKAAGLNRSDLLWIGAAFFTPELPALVGGEVCGIVETVGADVTRFAPGDRVTNLPIYTRGAARAYSHFAEHAVIPADELVHTPEALRDGEGAAFMFTTLTQICALTEVLQIKPGQTMLVTAGSSANGMSAILIGRRLGLRVIAATRGAGKRDMLLALGAHEVVATDDETLSERVRAITGGRGVDIAYDCVGGALSNEILKSLTPGGQWLMYGFLDPAPVTTSWPLWFAHAPTLHVFSLTQFTGMKELDQPGRPVELRRAVRTVLSLCGEREVPVPIARTFRGIEAVQEAFRAMAANVGGGKIVVEF